MILYEEIMMAETSLAEFGIGNVHNDGAEVMVGNDVPPIFLFDPIILRWR